MLPASRFAGTPLNSLSESLDLEDGDVVTLSISVEGSTEDGARNKKHYLYGHPKEDEE